MSETSLPTGWRWDELEHDGDDWYAKAKGHNTMRDKHMVYPIVVGWGRTKEDAEAVVVNGIRELGVY